MGLTASLVAVGLIAILSVLFSLVGPFNLRMADLIRNETALLENAIGHADYQLLDDDEDSCKVVTKAFTITFVWMAREKMFSSWIKVHAPPHHADDAETHTGAWFEAAGLAAPKSGAGVRSSYMLCKEVEVVGQAIKHVIVQEAVLGEALYFLAGRNRGYWDRVVVPEEAPPEALIAWMETEFRRA
jgi:hypothetical protein